MSCIMYYICKWVRNTIANMIYFLNLLILFFK